MDSQQVREFSDALVKDIIAERYASIVGRDEDERAPDPLGLRPLQHGRG
jgi:hypothetical protein